MRKNITLDDVDFKKLVSEVQDMSRNTPGSPDVYSLIVEALFGSCEDGVPNDEYNFAGDCLQVLIEMGYGVQELMPWT